MVSLNYHVDASKIRDLAKKLFVDIPPYAMNEATMSIAGETYGVMMQESPSSSKSGRGYRGPPLRFSITVERISPLVYSIGPTKKVGGKDLGIILTRGSPGGQMIRPLKKRDTLRFIWKGKMIFVKSVVRGDIPANNFMDRTAQIMEANALAIAEEEYFKKYKGLMV